MKRLHIILLVAISVLACAQSNEAVFLYENDILEIYPNIERRPFLGSTPTATLEREILFEKALQKEYTGTLKGRWYNKRDQEFYTVEFLVENGLVTEKQVHYENGKLAAIYNAKNRWITTYTKEGRLARESHMDKEQHVVYFSNGNVARESEEDYETVYYEDGKIKEHVERAMLEDGNIVNHGEYKSYFDNGRLMATGFYDEGRIDGLWISYDTTGSVVGKETYLEGNKIKSDL